MKKFWTRTERKGDEMTEEKITKTDDAAFSVDLRALAAELNKRADWYA